jgi:hypothetical protein
VLAFFLKRFDSFYLPPFIEWAETSYFPARLFMSLNQD